MPNTTTFEGKEYVSLEDYDNLKLEHDKFLKSVGAAVIMLLADTSRDYAEPRKGLTENFKQGKMFPVQDKCPLFD